MVFYNGKEDCGDEVLELKEVFQACKKPDGSEDAGKDGDSPDISVRVRMLNINHGRNKELLDACKPLAEYTWLIQRIQKYGEQMEIEEAVDKLAVKLNTVLV